MFVEIIQIYLNRENKMIFRITTVSDYFLSLNFYSVLLWKYFDCHKKFFFLWDLFYCFVVRIFLQLGENLHFAVRILFLLWTFFFLLLELFYCRETFSGAVRIFFLLIFSSLVKRFLPIESFWYTMKKRSGRLCSLCLVLQARSLWSKG